MHRHTVVRLLSVCALFTGCADLRHTLSWKSQAFVRVPAPTHIADNDRRMTEEVRGKDWNFKHVVSCPTKLEPEAHWWMVWPKDPEKLKLGNASWFKMLWTGTAIRHSDWRKIAAVTPEIADECKRTLGAYPQMVQPELVFKGQEAAAENERIKARHAAVENELKSCRHEDGVLELGALPAGGWAKGKTDATPFDPVWHHDSEFSELKQAKDEVRKKTGSAGGGIRIGLLDSGYNHHQILVPRNTIGEQRAGEPAGDALNSLALDEQGNLIARVLPGETDGEHGMKALSVLAGGAHPVVDPKKDQRRHPVIKEGLTVEIGGAPDATIVPARVAPWVFSHSTANLAYAIDYASRVQHCDVISMSHGGTPSALWIDAVNAAYDRGTATFAACGDYFNLFPFHTGLIAPSAAVYPAACRRILGVAGVSGNGTQYGKADTKHYPLHYLNPLNWFLMRGSFGADGAARDIWHTSLENMNERADRTEKKRGGLLHAHPISTWTPNVASAELPDKAHGYNPNLLNLNWGGTSAAAPQAAAAAALWLAQHRAEIERSGEWDKWQKAEAVYVAMLKSSGGLLPGDHGVPLDRRVPDLYCGTGSLKAATMLKIDYRNAKSTHIDLAGQPPNASPKARQLYFPEDRYGMNRDFYDGGRSGAAILGLGLEPEYPPYRQRAMPPDNKRNAPQPTRDDALKNIFFNQRLVQQWNIGRIPRKTPEEVEKDEALYFAQTGNHHTDAEDGKLKNPKTWFVRYFSPDSPELCADAQQLLEQTKRPRH